MFHRIIDELEILRSINTIYCSRESRVEANDNFFGHAERYLDAFMDDSSYAESAFIRHMRLFMAIKFY